MTQNIRCLLEDVRREAARGDFSVDSEVYKRFGRDPGEPVLFAGSLEGPLCIVGRDLGKDEVRAGQPLIGAAGRLVRAGIIRAREQSDASEQDLRRNDPNLEGALKHALLTNIVPFKPVANKAYPHAIRERFRPYLEQLLVNHWKGQNIVTLGTQAFTWFLTYGEEAEFRAVAATEARFERAFRCKISVHNVKRISEPKIFMVYPLPHPSPLNRRWFSRFPSMLAARLDQVHARSV